FRDRQVSLGRARARSLVDIQEVSPSYFATVGIAPVRAAPFSTRTALARAWPPSASRWPPVRGSRGRDGQAARAEQQGVIWWSVSCLIRSGSLIVAPGRGTCGTRTRCARRSNRLRPHQEPSVVHQIRRKE